MKIAVLLIFALPVLGQTLKINNIWHHKNGDYSKDSLQKNLKNAVICLKYNEIINLAFVADSTKKTSLKYRIVGDENYRNWTEIGNSLVLPLPNLGGGKYTLQLHNEQNKLVFQCTIFVEQPFWGNAWFYALVALYFIIIVSVGSYLFFLYDFRQKLKMQAVRNKIASDLHDEVGSNLTSIAIFTELLRKSASPEMKPILDKITNNSKESVTLMQDTVWAINPKNDSTEKLFERMKFFGLELLSGKNIAMTFDNQIDVKKVEFTMEQRKNIYLIFKEAVNNIAKHAEATKVSIDINKKNNVVSIIINDNGKGFDMTEEYEGNGLKNYQDRAIEAEIIVNVTSEKGYGTNVTMEVML